MKSALSTTFAAFTTVVTRQYSDGHELVVHNKT